MYISRSLEKLQWMTLNYKDMCTVTTDENNRPGDRFAKLELSLGSKPTVENGHNTTHST